MFVLCSGHITKVEALPTELVDDFIHRQPDLRSLITARLGNKFIADYPLIKLLVKELYAKDGHLPPEAFTTYPEASMMHAVPAKWRVVYHAAVPGASAPESGSNYLTSNGSGFTSTTTSPLGKASLLPPYYITLPHLNLCESLTSAPPGRIKRLVVDRLDDPLTPSSAEHLISALTSSCGSTLQHVTWCWDLPTKAAEMLMTGCTQLKSMVLNVQGKGDKWYKDLDEEIRWTTAHNHSLLLMPPKTIQSMEINVMQGHVLIINTWTMRKQPIIDSPDIMRNPYTFKGVGGKFLPAVPRDYPHLTSIEVNGSYICVTTSFPTARDLEVVSLHNRPNFHTHRGDNRGEPVCVQDLIHQGQVSKVHTLSITGANMLGLDSLQQHPDLRRVHLDAWARPINAAALSTAQQLEQLCLMGKVQNLEALASLTNLHTLEISNSKFPHAMAPMGGAAAGAAVLQGPLRTIPMAVLQVIASLPQLRTLLLPDVMLQQAAL